MTRLSRSRRCAAILHLWLLETAGWLVSEETWLERRMFGAGSSGASCLGSLAELDHREVVRSGVGGPVWLLPEQRAVVPAAWGVGSGRRGVRAGWAGWAQGVGVC